jgi:hypothetical protein
VRRLARSFTEMLDVPVLYSEPVPKKPKKPKKNPHAVALGRMGARKGGLARAKKLTPEERSSSAKKAGEASGAARMTSMTAEHRREIARKAAKARWAKKK